MDRVLHHVLLLSDLLVPLHHVLHARGLLLLAVDLVDLLSVTDFRVYGLCELLTLQSYLPRSGRDGGSVLHLNQLFLSLSAPLLILNFLDPLVIDEEPVDQVLVDVFFFVGCCRFSLF